jgi:hypothetical protein
MSVAGYFDKSTETKMPKGENPLGITSRDAVMTGEKSVEEARRDEAARAATDQLTLGKTRPGGYYRSVEEYDPVLRDHCRLNQ